MEKHIVRLTNDERENLLLLISKGKSAAKKLSHARILLAADENSGERRTNEAIAEFLHVSKKTVQRVCKECVENGLESALERKRHARYKPRKLQGEEEAKLIALCCSTPPEGRGRWTLKLLSDKLVSLEIVDSICPDTVRTTLKKMN